LLLAFEGSLIMNGRVTTASELVLRAAIQSAQPGGPTFEYFERQGSMEATLRQRFAEHVVGEDFDDVTGSEESAKLLRHLNRVYGTRHDVKHLPAVYRFLMGAITGFRRDHPTNAALLDSSDSVRDDVHCVLASSIARIKETGSNQPYSLASKFCRFLLPDTFPIFDDQAAASIAMWRYFAFECEVEAKTRESEHFTRRSIANDKSGSGYRGVLDFYRLVWSTSSNELREKACGTASNFQTQIRERYDTPQAKFTVLDLMDKLLWKGAGNPVVLGLATPQDWAR
jgi:hypothetical protein